MKMTAEVEEFGGRLAELVKQVQAGNEVVLTNGNKPVAKLVSAHGPKRRKSAAAFKARLNRVSPKPIPGVNEVLARLRR